ncbi:hypothetical protein LTR37_015700 [Vermiconidia calcicola]|uniref:Uncharacterized protein n=1 Tax=Vermiconidia calcicola TaxID=1690605 RepID=A0ACC3MRN9_9PEZI|nr:hypothetical protein LTR37_015700 [Vermiconidia calcicola]
MTAVASYPHANLSSPFALSTPPSARIISEGANGNEGKARSGDARVGQKRTLTPRASFSLGMERPGERIDDPGTPSVRPHSWLRRFSSNVSASRELTNTPASRPGSSVILQSNGSVAYSQAGSTTPIFSSTTPPSLPPNKLVKRASSVRSVNSSPLVPSGSRLPLPVFRRPATSHQRSATLQQRYSSSDQSDRMSIDDRDPQTRPTQLRQYFTTRVASDQAAFVRRHSTGIPNPIKRVYPDRKYTPILVNANASIKPAEIDVDDGLDTEENSMEVTKLTMSPSFASSPLPLQTTQLEESQPPRRSFSISDLLSTGPQPLWRRPSQNKGKTPGSKLVRRGRPRVASAPQAAMGSSLSRRSGTEPERPAKRRDLTDPGIAQRSIYSSASSKLQIASEATHEIHLNLQATPPQSSEADENGSPFEETASRVQTLSPLEQRRLPSATVYSSIARPVRVSAAQSEITSTVGSESEYRSVGDASTDYQSDTVYDSYPTRTTRSSSGRRGPHIEKIFDESPPTFSSGRSTRLKDLLHDGTFPNEEGGTRYRHHSTIEEEGSIDSTPVRSLHEKSLTSTPSTRLGMQHSFGSSPPGMPSMPDPDDLDWDAPDTEMAESGLEVPSLPTGNHAIKKSLPLRFGPAIQHSTSGSAEVTPSRPNGAVGDRANLFEWSEAQPSPGANASPPRPRTVHGKKDQESRGSRPAGRRGPSGMHARSHSVPVVPDADGKRHAVANKFGTWGVGSKAVTEDWNDDFDFEELPTPIAEQVLLEEKRIDSGHEMFVPKSIREQQENVVANISLLREWGLLIEELKDLRIRAVALDMLNGPYAHDWQEVDAMIELADQETAEATLEPRRSPPSSPGFDESAFEEPLPNIADTAKSQRPSIELWDPVAGEIDTFAGASAHNGPSTPQHIIITRPRKDSEAVARSVIAAIQSKRTVSEPAALHPIPPSKKVPFDTATLRHIVPYVKDLKRKVKDALRETEGLYSSPRRRKSPALLDHEEAQNEPAFRSIFNGPQPENALARRRSRREQAATDHDAAEGSSADQHGELAKRMKNMNIPH